MNIIRRILNVAAAKPWILIGASCVLFLMAVLNVTSETGRVELLAAIAVLLLSLLMAFVKAVRAKKFALTLLSGIVIIFVASLVTIWWAISLKKVSQPPSLSVEEVPAFPWPPPLASAREVLPRSFFTADVITLGQVDQLLSDALDANGYFERSYFAVPSGFALVTKLEQIEDDGKSKPLPERWSSSPPHLISFSLREYTRALLSANEGHYRVIVFIVTDVPFQQSLSKVTETNAFEWLRDGFNILPDAVSQTRFAEGAKCTALIYEFVRTAASPPQLLLANALDARTHLMRAGIWAELSTRAKTKTFLSQVRLTWQHPADLDLHVALTNGDELSYQTPCGRHERSASEYIDFGKRVGCLQRDIQSGPGAEFVLLKPKQVVRYLSVYYYNGKGPCAFQLTTIFHDEVVQTWSGMLASRGSSRSYVP